MEKRWLSPEDLLVRWQAKPFEIVEAHKSGLPLYDEKGNCIIYPARLEELSLKEQQKFNKLYSKLFDAMFHEDPWEREETVFKLSDVVAYEKEQGIHFITEKYGFTARLKANTLISPEEYFPELNIHLLKMQAERWVKNFSEAPIKRILLYNYSSKYEGMMIARNGLPPHPAIYAIVFDVDIIDKTTNMSAEDRLQYDLMGVRGERQQESYERLLVATKPNKRIEDNEQYYDLMTKDFAKVYKNPSKHDYREEWQFYCIFKNTYNKTPLTGNVRTDEPHIVLWPDWGQKIHDLAIEACHDGHIKIIELCQVLAFYQESSAVLPALWRKYKVENGPYPLKINSFTERVGAWFKLINLWTSGYNGIRLDDDIICIKTGFKKGGRYIDDPANKGDRVNLQVLKDYFANTILVPTPLPELLFPGQADSCVTSCASDSKPIQINTPPDTVWGQIRISVINHERIEITHPNGMSPWTSRDLGFEGKRTLWPLFEQFAKERGQLKPHNHTEIRANVSNLRKHLKAIFPRITGRPISCYNSTHGLECNFLINHQGMTDHQDSCRSTEDNLRDDEGEDFRQEFSRYEDTERFWSR